jgi:type IV pilus assembly protein PilX
MNYRSPITSKSKQNGSVLIVSLIVLILITVIALSSLRGAKAQEKMAVNNNSRNIAIQMAESALREAESLLRLSPDSISIANANAAVVSGLNCLMGEASDYDFSDSQVWLNNNPCTYSGGKKNSVKTPEYFVEFFYAAPIVDMSDPLRLRTCFYRITARGYGLKESSSVTLQSTFRFTNCS